MRAVVDRLQGFAPKPPGRVAFCSRVRLGTGATRRSALVPDVAQPVTGVCGPKGDQLQTPDVPVSLSEEHPDVPQGVPRQVWPAQQ